MCKSEIWVNEDGRGKKVFIWNGASWSAGFWSHLVVSCCFLMLGIRNFTWSVNNLVLMIQTPVVKCPTGKCGFFTPDTPWKDQSRHVVSAHWPTHLPIKSPNLEKQRWRRRFDWSRGVDWWPVSKYGNRCQQHWNTTPSLNAALWRLSLQTWQNFLARAILIVGKGGHWTVKTFEVITGLPENKEVTKTTMDLGLH